jgi:hypothetical protein
MPLATEDSSCLSELRYSGHFPTGKESREGCLALFPRSCHGTAERVGSYGYLDMSLVIQVTLNETPDPPEAK